MLQMEKAKKGEVTKEIENVAESENVRKDKLRKQVAAGKVVIPRNIVRENIEPRGIGEGLTTKINANIGTSPDFQDLDKELRKAKIAVEHGADAIMDLSIGGDLDKIRREIISLVDVPVGSVPIYNAAVETVDNGKDVVDMSSDDIFNSIRKHAEDGVDFVTVHCGVTKSTIENLKRKGRLMDFVSRGGSFLAAWILHNDRENPLYDEFDYLLEICQEYDLTLSLGDGLRPGCIADASDSSQFKELLTLGELVDKSRDFNIQAMVEGPGHLPLDHIEPNVKIQKEICNGAPFYVLGPLVTDIAPGYDHIVGAIGGAVAARAGADFLCYVTPAEHLCLPNEKDVKEGVIASRIAAHSADLSKGYDGDRDEMMAEARKSFDWESQYDLSLDPDRARNLSEERPTELDSDACSMCSDLCALKMVRDFLGDGV